MTGGLADDLRSARRRAKPLDDTGKQGLRRLETAWAHAGRAGPFLVGLVSAAGAATAVYLAFLAPSAVVSARISVTWIDPNETLKDAMVAQGNLGRFEGAARRKLTPGELACVLNLRGAVVYYRIDVQGMKQAPIEATLRDAATDQVVAATTTLQDNTYTARGPYSDQGAGAAWVAAPLRRGHYFVVLAVRDSQGNLRDDVRSPAFYERTIPSASC